MDNFTHDALRKASKLLKKSRRKKKLYKEKRLADGYGGIDSAIRVAAQVAKKEHQALSEAAKERTKMNGQDEYNQAVKILVELAELYEDSAEDDPQTENRIGNE